MVRNAESLRICRWNSAPAPGRPSTSARKTRACPSPYWAVWFSQVTPSTVPRVSSPTSPSAPPNTRLCTSTAREAAVVNQPRSSTGSGSQAPKNRQRPSHRASTQAWLSSQWDHRGAYTCRAGMPTLRRADTRKADSSPHRPLPFRYTVKGEAVRSSCAWYPARSRHQRFTSCTQASMPGRSFTRGQRASKKIFRWKDKSSSFTRGNST